MQQPIWASLEPTTKDIKVLVSEAGRGTVLKARLPLPQTKHGLRMLLESLSHWYGRPLVAVINADAEEVAAHPERWGVWLADTDDLDVTVRWLRRRDRVRPRAQPSAFRALGHEPYFRSHFCPRPISLSAR